ncbi:MAG: TetR/AcrR family transcriptional regulator [Jatrophihabitantaceae bacterium]
MHRNKRTDDRQPTPRGRPRDQAAEHAILDAALALFAQGGLAATTFDGVAKRAGVSRSTLYRRWRTRDDLIIAALQWVRAQGETGVEDWAARPYAEVMSIFKTLTVQALADARSMDLLRQVTALPDPSPIREAYWSAVVQPRRNAYTALVTAARSRGELPHGADPDLLQDQLAGALAYRALVNPRPISRREAEDYTQRLLESLGLLAPVMSNAPPHLPRTTDSVRRRSP